MSPENLYAGICDSPSFAYHHSYFILWLREYTTKYRKWKAQTDADKTDVPVYLGVWPSEKSQPLAMFYSRAKETFFTPNANHELNLPSDILAPIRTPNGSAHPDPHIFDRVAVEVHKMLQESLQRFVAAQFSNVGSPRALCGVCAGLFCLLVGGLLPILYTIFVQHSRWLRITAIPGLWMGLTLMLTSLNGVCLGIYVFGDLRQLRKFELSRPAISRPQAFYSSTNRRPVPSASISNPLQTQDTTDQSVVSTRLSGVSNGSSDDIHISPAYYDMHPVDGPALSPNGIHFSEKDSDTDSEMESGPDTPTSANAFIPTAMFIHPYDSGSEDSIDPSTRPDELTNLPHKPRLPEEAQRITEFDFESLPHPPRRLAEEARMRTQVLELEQCSNPYSPLCLLRRWQERCSVRFKGWVQGAPLKPKKKLSFGFKKETEVPAFGPMTKILSPVVVRGQWEIVVRSVVLALFGAWLIIGPLLAIPPRV